MLKKNVVDLLRAPATFLTLVAANGAPRRRSRSLKDATQAANPYLSRPAGLYDSPLERAGFEPSVPGVVTAILRPPAAVVAGLTAIFARLHPGGESHERTRLGNEIPELAKNQIFRGFWMIPAS
jgi:hypothetical protein